MIELRDFKEGEFLLSPEVPLKGVYLIMSGIVEVCILDKMHESSSPVSLGAKDTLGIVSIYESVPRLERAVARSSVKTFYISRENFLVS